MHYTNMDDVFSLWVWRNLVDSQLESLLLFRTIFIYYCMSILFTKLYSVLWRRTIIQKQTFSHIKFLHHIKVKSVCFNIPMCFVSSSNPHFCWPYALSYSVPFLPDGISRCLQHWSNLSAVCRLLLYTNKQQS